MRVASNADVVITAAAVADYTPASPAMEGGENGQRDHRTPQHEGHPGRSGPCDRPGQRWRFVGFAAETRDAVARARESARGKSIRSWPTTCRCGSGVRRRHNAVTIVGEGSDRGSAPERARVAGVIRTGSSALPAVARWIASR